MVSVAEVQTLEQKFIEERNKRLKGADEAAEQYVAIKNTEHSEYAADPFVDYERARAAEPSVHEGSWQKVVIVGAGHHGLLFAVRLIEAGISADDILLVDNAGGYGGAWYWNRYPGLMCDVEGYIYLPLLEETGYVPKHRYSYGQEIRANAEQIAAKYKLRALFTSTVTSLDWDDDRGEWNIQMSRVLHKGDKPVQLGIRSQFAFVAAGPFTSPKMPAIPGIDDFLGRGGQIFHTARWNYSVTGGSQEEPEMLGLKGKKVGIVGTGATSVQVVPEVAKYAKELFVFQRTPSFIGVRAQKLTTPEDWRRVASAKGWQAARAQNFHARITNEPEDEDLIVDGWTEGLAFAAFIGGKGRFPFVTPETIEEHVSYFMDLDAERTAKIRARVDQEVGDVAVAEKLKPWYPGWCKRPVFNDDYLQTFNLPHVHLVDTNGKGVETFSRRGIIANGIDHDLDVIILGTGYESHPAATPTTRSGAPIHGRGGRSFDDKWDSPTEFGTLHGFMCHGFPNLFFQGAAHQGMSFNLTGVYDIQAKHLAFLVKQALSCTPSGERAVIEAPQEAEDEWNKEIAKGSLWLSTMQICTPGYFTGDGKVKPPASPEEAQLASKRLPYCRGPVRFSRELQRWRDSGKWAELFSTRTETSSNGI
ncbi:uncharacterized protein Z518_03599 [Rhinocladiella mackenziei CBS 650.93]|uniref:Uncharacterized protein n=1 Tax=Rhinocladiella mackenziei CBS 650.93 TaxID=1442369 RepID=A0A0D2FU45_9EURO|nr:uncharacterized protein Z518_03599 [Rhinocladiella mackenziei CBS 650.93]KIX05627.1 hypothetical protein Z518_03599 [Rhinocladiella mackenziei CBS 650.93]